MYGPFFFLVLLIAVVYHEYFHAIAAEIVNLPIKTVGVGLRFPPKLEGVTKNGLVWWVSPWLLTAMVSPYPIYQRPKNKITNFAMLIRQIILDIKKLPESMEDSRFLLEKPWKRIVIVVAGPLANLLLALVTPMILLGPLAGLSFISQINAEFLPSLFTALPWEYGSFDQGILEWAFLSYVLNMVLLLINILPIPPIDGGHVMLAVIDWLMPVEGRQRKMRTKAANFVALAVTCLILVTTVVSIVLMFGTLA